MNNREHLITINPFFKIYCGVEQLVACWAHNPKVGGSSPPPVTYGVKGSNDDQSKLPKILDLTEVSLYDM